MLHDRIDDTDQFPWHYSVSLRASELNNISLLSSSGRSSSNQLSWDPFY